MLPWILIANIQKVARQCPTNLSTGPPEIRDGEFPPRDALQPPVNSRPEPDMRTYKGGCHCGQVRFEVKTDLAKAVDCNCSICTRKGVLHHRVPPGRFSLLSGHDALTLYQFGSKTAKHWFCRHCGIHPFSNPRVAPEMYSINIRCLDDFDQERTNIEVMAFDGKNWEEAIKTIKV